MAAITYDNVSTDGESGGGNIFKDVKFWVAQRVPSRATLLQKITSNGGSVVPLEKQADMMIADHVRKDVPPGSYSWKFIDDSVTHGLVQLKDKYAIGRDPSLPRPAASGGLKKHTRIPYTAADDAALAKYVLAQMQMGQSTSGNKIFQQWEQGNPRHTWQSWRDRWVKHLQVRSMAVLKDLADSAPPGEYLVPGHDAQAPPPESPRSLRIPKELTATADRTSPEVPRPQFREPPPTSAPEASPQVDQDPGKSPASGYSDDAKSQREEVAHHAAQDPATPETTASIIEDSQIRELRDRFYKDLNDYVTVQEIDLDFQPRIGGKGVELFDLMQAVEIQNRDADDVDWTQVMRSLGYRNPEDATIQHELAQCYQRDLVPFNEVMGDFEDSEKDGSALEDDSDGDIFETAPATQHYRQPSVTLSSSLPDLSQMQQRKRSLDALPESRGQGSKRRRLGRNEEIPATPEEELLHGRMGREAQESPSKGRGVVVEVVEDSQRAAGSPQRLSPVLGSVSSRSRPPPPASLPRQDTFEFSPSQQLHDNAVDARPVPLNLERESRAPQQSSKKDDNRGPKTTAARSTGRPQGSATRRSLPLSFDRRKRQRSPLNADSALVQNSTQNRSVSNARPIAAAKEKPTGNQNDIGGCVEYFQSLGYPHDIVIEALKRTTMTPGGLASMVMESLLQGQGVPSHHEGVWTDRDDTGLHLIDSVGSRLKTGAASTKEQADRVAKAKRESDRIIKKHGLDRMELRRRFLAAQAALTSARRGPGPRD